MSQTAGQGRSAGARSKLETAGSHWIWVVFKATGGWGHWERGRKKRPKNDPLGKDITGRGERQAALTLCNEAPLEHLASLRQDAWRPIPSHTLFDACVFHRPCVGSRWSHPGKSKKASWGRISSTRGPWPLQLPLPPNLPQGAPSCHSGVSSPVTSAERPSLTPRWIFFTRLMALWDYLISLFLPYCSLLIRSVSSERAGWQPAPRTVLGTE